MPMTKMGNRLRVNSRGKPQLPARGVPNPPKNLL